MTDYRTLLEHDLRLVGPAGFSMHDLSRRRKSKRRNQRIGSAALALIVAAAAIGLLVRAFHLDEAPRPADLPITPGAWSRFPFDPDGVEAITAGGPGLVAVGAGERRAAVWTSSDGRTWTPVPGQELGPGSIMNVATGGPGLVAVGTSYNELASIGGHANGPFHAVVWTSEDGLTWSRLPNERVFRNALFASAVTSGGPGVVAVGAHNTAWFSSDGATWDLAAVPPVPEGVYPGDDGEHPQIYLTDVAAGNDRLVAVGWAMLNDNSEVPVVWTSVDGMSWADVPLDPEVFPRGRDIADITHGPNGFVAVGSHNQGAPPTAWTSPDGLQWHRVASDQEAFVSHAPLPRTSFAMWSVAASESGYVAVGADGYCWRGAECPSAEAAIWTSTDGESWVRVSPGEVFKAVGPITSEPNHGAYAGRVVAWGSRFVVEGRYQGRGAIWISNSDAQPTMQPTPQPTDVSPRPDTTALPEFRRNGDIILLEPPETGTSPDLAAQDPETGGVRTIVETEGILECPDSRCQNFVKRADWSSDGRWVAFEVTFALEGAAWGPCGATAGIWLSNALGSPRQLTKPCDDPPPAVDPGIEELWAWSPVGAKLAYARVDSATDELFVIDPLDGHRTLVGTAESDLTALEWSPDGTNIAYADGVSVYEVQVDGGDRSLLGDSFADVVEIKWSPDGRQIMVLDQGRYRLQVMNADGSDLHLLVEGEDACCGPEWSPDGTRIAYLISRRWGSMFEYDTEIWTIEPDGSNRIKIFDSNRCDTLDAEPVWAPNDSQVAYNACNRWVVANADGTAEANPIDELVYLRWKGGSFWHPMRRIAGE